MQNLIQEGGLFDADNESGSREAKTKLNFMYKQIPRTAI